MAKVKKIPMITSKRRRRDRDAGWRTDEPDGSFFRCLLIAERISCLTPLECVVAFCSSSFEVGRLPPVAWLSWSIARGTTNQRKSATRPASAR